MFLTNYINIIVVVSVIFICLLVLFFRFLFPKIKNRKVKQKGLHNDCKHCNCNK